MGAKMDKLLTVIFYILMIAEYVTFYYTVIRKDKWRVYKRFGSGRLLLAGALLCGIVCIGGFMEWYSGFELVPILGGTLLVMYLLFQVSFADNFRIWLIAFFMISILELAIDSILRIFLSESEIWMSIIHTIVVIALLWVYYLLLGRRLDESTFLIPGQIWWMIAGMLLLLTAMLSFFYALITKIEEWNGRRNYTIYAIGGSFILPFALLFCILLFSMVFYFNNTRRFYMETEILEDFNEQQKEYFIRLLNREQETKKFRHDIENELLQLRHYFECGNYEQLGDYLSDMMGEMKSIRGKKYDVGNDIVNTIINYYFLDIENTRVWVSGYLGDGILVNQRDLCILVSNLIKNAVEAVTLSEIERQIGFCVEKGKQYLGFHIENSIGNNVPIKKNGIPVTTKKDRDRHGIGLLNVQSIVERYEGWYQQEIKNDTYIVDVRLKNMTVYREK